MPVQATQENYDKCGHCHGNYKERDLFHDTGPWELGWICRWCWDEYDEETRMEPDCPECQEEISNCRCRREE